jgi:HK97 family phage major capsid protein
MNLRQMLARKEQITIDMSKLLDEQPDGVLSPEVRTRADALAAEAEGLTVRARHQAMIDGMALGAGGIPLDGSGDGRFDDLAAKVTVLDTIRAQIGGFDDAGCGRAREVSKEMERRSGRPARGMYWPWRRQAEQRALNLTTGAGGNLVQTDVAPATIDILRPKSVLMRAGATTVSDLRGNLSIPRLAASSTAYWVTDGVPALTGSNPTFDVIAFTPRTVGGLVPVSRQLLQQSTPDVNRIVENDLLAICATAIDAAGINGPGSGGQPLGLLQSSPTVIPGGTNGLAITWNNIQALIGAVDLSNALEGKLAFATNAHVTKQMRSTLKTSADTASNFIQTTPDELAGYPCFSSANVPAVLTKGTATAICSAMIYGDWSSVMIAMWGGLDLEVNPYDSVAFAAGGVLVRALASVDINFRHLAAFAVIDDILA